MRPLSRFLAIPLIMAAAAVTASGEVRDKAGLFSPEAVKRGNAELARIELDTRLPVTIETTSSLEGLSINQALPKYAQRDGVRGMFILIARSEGKIDAQASREYQKYFNRPLFDKIYEAFVPGLRRKDFDSALSEGIASLDTTLKAIKAEHGSLTPVTPTNAPAAQRARAGVPARAKSGFGLSSLIMIVLLVVGVLIVVRLLGALMGAGRGGAGYGGQGYGGPMRGPGGYGAPGYGGGGGGGGGFMSSMFGGIGGALAGNWLYDQFSGGRHHGADQSGYAPGADPAQPAEAGPDWAGAGDGGGDWGGDQGGGAGGGGGGDWGGGGGGDWGGGGGGGGGDWGGGGGGGGGDGGSW